MEAVGQAMRRQLDLSAREHEQVDIRIPLLPALREAPEHDEGDVHCHLLEEHLESWMTVEEFKCLVRLCPQEMELCPDALQVQPEITVLPPCLAFQYLLLHEGEEGVLRGLHGDSREPANLPEIELPAVIAGVQRQYRCPV